MVGPLRKTYLQRHTTSRHAETDVSRTTLRCHHKKKKIVPSLCSSSPRVCQSPLAQCNTSHYSPCDGAHPSQHSMHCPAFRLENRKKTEKNNKWLHWHWQARRPEWDQKNSHDHASPFTVLSQNPLKSEQVKLVWHLRCSWGYVYRLSVVVCSAPSLDKHPDEAKHFCLPKNTKGLMMATI